MKVLYLANIRLPTEKAHGVQIMKTCEALAAAGVAIELLVTDRRTPITQDPFAYYGITDRFPIRRLPVWDTVIWGRLGFYLESFSFARQALRYARSAKPDTVYGRDELVLWWMPKNIPLVWEPHTGAWNAAARSVARRAKKIVVISQGLKDFYVSRGIPPEKIIIARDAVDVEQFAPGLSKAEARAKLGLSGGSIVVYTGSRQVHKGVATLEQAQQLLPGVQVLVVSGKPYTDMPLYLRAADVLVLPNSAKEQVSKSFTSPMKLFEYMASGVPIVASDLPSIREVLGEEDAYFFAPDDPQALAAAVQKALSDPEAAARAARARAKVGDYTWAARAKKISAAILS